MASGTSDAGPGGKPVRSFATGAGRASPAWAIRRLGLPSLLVALCGNAVAQASPPAADAGARPQAARAPEKQEATRLWMTVGERRFSISLADTEAARAFAAMLPLTLDMEELNGNEKKKELPSALPTNASRPGTIRSGDVLLWGSRTVVVFYLSFDSPYSYTRLGRVDEPAGLADALGRGDVRVVFSKR